MNKPEPEALEPAPGVGAERWHTDIMENFREWGPKALQSMPDRWKLMLYLCRMPHMKERADAWAAWAKVRPGTAGVIVRVVD